ncbi:MAG TPA: c-type cytochrome [Polyangiaceae bacterium]|nr:c-type cytochrome [Polyangiaceae bacterium]
MNKPNSKCMAWLIGLVTLLGCSEEPLSEVPHGRRLFTSNSLSPSKLNLYSCASCHDEGNVSGGLRKSGALLGGSISRPTFWGGQENDLLDAVNACRSYFMVAPEPLLPTEPDAIALYAYLASLRPVTTTAVPFTVVRDIQPLERGDASRGEPLYTVACSYCHGLAHTGVGRLRDSVSLLPEQTNMEHASLSKRLQRIVFIEKVRHGSFLGYGGDMPPFSEEVLNDSELADVLEYLAVTGE